jgi:signal transduction histidine kinase
MGTLNQTIDDIRGYIFDLQTPPPCELQDELQNLVSNLKLDTLLEVDFRGAEPCPGHLTPLQIANLTQITREALHNIVQHADARHVAVDLSYDDHHVCLTVTDDGKGLDPAQPADNHHRGFGIANMRARAELMGGQFTLESAPGQGARVTVVAPYGDNHRRSEAR